MATPIGADAFIRWDDMDNDDTHLVYISFSQDPTEEGDITGDEVDQHGIRDSEIFYYVGDEEELQAMAIYPREWSLIDYTLKYSADDAPLTYLATRIDYIRQPTWGQGMVTTTYDKLVELFGIPMAGGDKTQVEWVIKWSDDTITTIYDWKCYGVDPEDIIDWSVGGNSCLSIEHLEHILK
jgi:hypothetical protein